MIDWSILLFSATIGGNPMLLIAQNTCYTICYSSTTIVKLVRIIYRPHKTQSPYPPTIVLFKDTNIKSIDMRIVLKIASTNTLQWKISTLAMWPKTSSKEFRVEASVAYDS